MDLETNNKEKYEKALEEWQKIIEDKLDEHSKLIDQVEIQLNNITKLIKS